MERGAPLDYQRYTSNPLKHIAQPLLHSPADMHKLCCDFGTRSRNSAIKSLRFSLFLDCTYRKMCKMCYEIMTKVYANAETVINIDENAEQIASSTLARAACCHLLSHACDAAILIFSYFDIIFCLLFSFSKKKQQEQQPKKTRFEIETKNAQPSRVSTKIINKLEQVIGRNRLVGSVRLSIDSTNSSMLFRWFFSQIFVRGDAFDLSQGGG